MTCDARRSNDTSTLENSACILHAQCSALKGIACQHLISAVKMHVKIIETAIDYVIIRTGNTDVFIEYSKRYSVKTAQPQNTMYTVVSMQG